MSQHPGFSVASAITPSTHTRKGGSTQLISSLLSYLQRIRPPILHPRLARFGRRMRGGAAVHPDVAAARFRVHAPRPFW